MFKIHEESKARQSDKRFGVIKQINPQFFLLLVFPFVDKLYTHEAITNNHF